MKGLRFMNRTLATGGALAALLLLAGCGGGGNGSSGSNGNGSATAGTPKVSVQDLAPGSYTVSVGNADQPTVGKYYAGEDGSRLLLLAKTDDTLDSLFRRDGASPAWVAVPASQSDLELALLRSDPMAAQVADAGALAGNYVAALSDGTAARFAVDAAGAIAAGDTDCKLSGRLSAGKLPSTLALDLNASNCAGLAAANRGALVIDGDYAPARFRLVGDNGTQSLDLWAYKE